MLGEREMLEVLGCLMSGCLGSVQGCKVGYLGWCVIEVLAGIECWWLISGIAEFSGR